MILAQKVVRDDGVLLCQKGAELNEGMLRMLERMNYENVFIEEEEKETPEEKAARLKKEEAVIEARFALVGSDPILTALKKTLLKRLAEEG